MSNELFARARHNLRSYWGFDSFRRGQDKAIQSVLNGNNTLVLFPTGGGKSLCYQVPATVLEGLTVVISPLVALMQDQVQQLQDRGISATFLNSMISSREMEQRLVNARNGMYDLLYCAPERLKTDLWKAELPKLEISLIAIDEAHCISQWGHDFRPSYRDIKPSMQTAANEATWIALTATATPEVQKDIQENLGFEDAEIITKGFQRPNLKWWVDTTERKDKRLLTTVKKAAAKGSGLIYAGTRRNCKRLSEDISRQLGIPAAAYHAGVESVRRKQIQQQWISGDLPIVVATSAFGMGIDKGDCRYVIHYEMPYTLEAYYQQAGRAGRDDEESYPLLLVKQSDLNIAEQRIKDSYPEKQELQKVYDVLCDELSLTIGSLLEEPEDVSLQALRKRSGLPPQIIRSSLKVLQRLGVISMRKHVVPQIGIRFVANPDYIREQIETANNEAKASFLDVIFRQYGGEAFGEMKYLKLEYLQEKLNLSPNAITKGLQVLQNHDQMLQFKKIGESPLIKVMEERQSTLRLQKKEIEGHRQNLLTKLDYMRGYIRTEMCREKYIRRYFGEKKVSPCGHCDNCLSDSEPGEKYITKAAVEQVKSLCKEPKTLYEIGKDLGWSSARVKRILGHLIREEKISKNGEKYSWRD